VDRLTSMQHRVGGFTMCVSPPVAAAVAAAADDDDDDDDDDVTSW